MAVIDELRILVTAQVQEAIANLDKTERQSNKTSTSFKDLAKNIVGYTTAANLAVGATKKVISGIGDLAKESVVLAASFEKSKTEWGVFLADMNKGNDMFAKLFDFAAKTPLAFKSVNSAAITLKGFGVEAEDIIPTMQKLGDVSLGNNEKLSHLALVFGQVKAQGKAMAQDLYQFVNAGVPIFQLLADTMDVSAGEIKDLGRDGKITFSEIERAIDAATSQGGLFYKMMDKTSETLSGRWSTAQDNFNNLLASLGKAVIPTVNAALDSFNKMFETKDLDDYTKALEKSNKIRKAALESISKATDPRAKSAYQQLIDQETERGNQLGKTIQYLQTVKMIEDQIAEEKKDQEEKDAQSLRSAELKAAHDRSNLEMIARMKSEAAEKEKDDARKQWEYEQEIDEKRKKNLKDIADAESKASDAYIEAVKKQILEEAALHEKALEYQEKLEEEAAERRKKTIDDMVNASMSGYQSMANALGGALFTGEEGWKAFGRSGLNAIAGIVEAMAMESDILIAKTLAEVGVGQLWKAPGIPAAIGASVAAHTAAGAIRAIPMAEGGVGTVTKPTLFLAGEAGPEDFAFGPKRKGGLGASVVVNMPVYGTIVSERQLDQRIIGAVQKAARGF